MSQTFLHKFCHEIQTNYAEYFPQLLHTTAVELDCKHYHWLNIRFGITHERQVDELYIRLSQREISIDFSWGARVPTCLVDSFGVRWIEIDLEGSKLCPFEKTQVEALSKTLYAVVHTRAPQLRFVLGGEGAIAITKEVRSWL